MRKIYAFLAAALISVCAFASKDVVPTDAVLADYYTSGDVCVCFFVPSNMNCNDIVLTGSFNGWKSTAAQCLPVEAVEGYDGWYVVSFEPEAEPDAQKGIQAKPVMLDAYGVFNWDYQVGTVTKIRGGVEVVAGFSGEIDLINYGTDVPNVFTVDSWKQNPCTAVYHNYTITVISDGCDGLVLPYIVGTMTSWADNGWTQMQLDVAKTTEYGIPTYYYSFKAAEGGKFQIVSGMMDPNTGLPDSTDGPGWKDKAYIQEYKDGVWDRISGDDSDHNTVLGEEANIVIDLRSETLRWARCAPDEREDVVVTLTPPAGAPEIVQIIGSFDDWAGTAMTLGANGKFTANVRMQATDEFKFRTGMLVGDANWAVQIQIPDADPESETGWKDMGNLKVGDWWETSTTPKTLDVDFSDDADYRWTPTEPQGIENVVLTEKAQKVIVDGVMYIIRDNKMYNAQGTQVR